MSDKKFFHGVKKTLNVYKTNNPTKDPEYDNVYAQFKDIGKQCEKLMSSVKQSKTCWDPMKRNIQQSLDSVKNAFVDGRARGLADDGHIQLEDWSSQLAQLREDESSCRINEAERMLQSYILYVKTANQKCSKRQEAVKNVDYYRGKVEELQAKANLKPKEQERLQRAQRDLQNHQDQFDSLNKEVICDLHKAVGYKEDVFTRCLVAYLDMTRQVMAFNHFSQILDSYNDVLTADWPHIEEIASSSFVASGFDSKRNSNAASGATTPAGDKRLSQTSHHSNNDELYPPAAPEENIIYEDDSFAKQNNIEPPPPPPETKETEEPVAKGNHEEESSTPIRALYDFDATNDEELTFKAGETLELYEVLDENWMYGGVNGRSGIFPVNYVEYI